MYFVQPKHLAATLIVKGIRKKLTSLTQAELKKLFEASHPYIGMKEKPKKEE